MASRYDAEKENAHQQSNAGKDNWPEVEIRAAGKTAGKALHTLFTDSLNRVITPGKSLASQTKEQQQAHVHK